MKQFKFRIFPCGLLCAILLLGTSAQLTFTSCENQYPEINISLTSDYSGIINEINNANKTLTEKLTLIESAVNQGQISTQSSLDLIKKALETLTGSLDEKSDAIMKAIQSQTTTLESKLGLIQAALDTGLTDANTSLALIKEAINSVSSKLGTMDTDLTNKLNDVITALNGISATLSTGEIAAALTNILNAINGLTGYSDILDAIKEVIGGLAVTPGYNFLHLSYYTFNSEYEMPPFITKRDFAGNDGSVTWWSQAYPSYLNGDGDISNRHALKKYDIAPLNLIELAFNVVNDKDEIMSDEEIAAAGLSMEFSTIGTTDYSSLWMTPTVFYYKSKEPFIQVSGKLFLSSDGTKTPLPTRFSKPKASVTYPEEELDYSSYAIVAWQPFKEMTLVKDTYTISLDENKMYVVALADVTGLALKDNRPNGVTYDVFKDNDWITGNVTDPNATSTSGGNGYISGVSSRQAYSITPRATAEVSSDLKRLAGVKYSADGVSFSDEQNSDGSLMPYFVFDYSSQVMFHGELSIPVTITFESPWQDVSAKCTIVVKGVE